MKASLWKGAYFIFKQAILGLTVLKPLNMTVSKIEKNKQQELLSKCTRWV